jgi:hypothetical protein
LFGSTMRIPFAEIRSRPFGPPSSTIPLSSTLIE